MIIIFFLTTIMISVITTLGFMKKSLIKLKNAKKYKISARAFHRGYPIVYVNDKWLFEDDWEPTPEFGGKERRCFKCGKEPNKNGEDACLGHLPGVTAACCGHGKKEYSYIHFENGVKIYKFEGLYG